MMWLPYLSCLTYVLSCFLSWYRDKFRFRPGWTRPLIPGRGNGDLYGLGNLMLTLAAIAGLWYSFGLTIAGGALAVELVFHTIMVRVYYNRAFSVAIAQSLGVLGKDFLARQSGDDHRGGCACKAYGA